MKMSPIQEFKKLVEKLPPKAGQGPDGWAYEHVKFLVKGRHCDDLAALVRVIQQGAMPRAFVSWFAAAKLLPLQKRDTLRDCQGKLMVRPVAIGCVWRRLVGRTVTAPIVEKVGAELAKYGQYGLGIKDGGTHIVHALNIAMSQEPGCGIFGSDARAAFNFISRDAIWYRLRELQRQNVLAKEAVAKLTAYTRYCYLDPAAQALHYENAIGAPAMEIIPSTTGVQMGCSAGSLLFALVWTMDILKPITESIPGATCFGQIDDLHVLAPVDKLDTVSKLVQSRAEMIGVSLNLDKSFYAQVPASHNSQGGMEIHSGNLSELSDELLQEIPIRNLSTDGFTVNGIPVGAVCYKEQWCEKFERTLKGVIRTVVGLTKCSARTRVLLLRCCVNAKFSHVARGLSPTIGARWAADFDAAMRCAFAAVTYTSEADWTLTAQCKAGTQLAFSPRFGGMAIGAQEKFYDARFLGSFVSCWQRLKQIPRFAPHFEDTLKWTNDTGIFHDVATIWDNGINGGPISELPRLRKCEAIIDENGDPQLQLLCRLKSKTSKVFADAVAEHDFTTHIDDASTHEKVKARLQAAAGYGATDWTLATAGEGLTEFKDEAHYLAALAFTFGLQHRVLQGHTTCIAACAQAGRDTRARRLNVSDDDWLTGEHHLACLAGKLCDRRVNAEVRHDRLMRVWGEMLRDEKFRVSYDLRTNQYDPASDKAVDITACRMDGTLPQAFDVTIVNALAPSYRSEVAKKGVSAVLAKADKRKEAKHAVSVQSTGAKFVSLAFDARGAMGPSARSYFKELWKAKIQEAREMGQSQWPVIAAMLRWRKRFGVCIMNAAAEMLLSRVEVECDG